MSRSADPSKIDPPKRAAGRRLGGRSRPVVRRAITPDEVASDGDDARRRAMLADYLRLMAWWMGRPPAPALPPRLDQTLRALLAGDAEKQVARRLGVSVHTAHAYIKELYKRMGVTTRGELLCRFLPDLPVQG